jgi:hypothetical protein
MLKRLKDCSVVVVILLVFPLLKAQDTSSQGSQPSAQQAGTNSSNSGPASQVPGIPESPEPEVQPDNHPLTGMDLLGLGTLVEQRSYILPVFTIGEAGDTNTFVEPGLSDYETTTLPMGSITLQAVGRKNIITASYEGGGLLYNKRPSLDTYFQIGNFSDVLQGERWQFELTDILAAMPGSTFGLAGVGVIGGFGENPEASMGLGTTLGQLNPMVASQSSVLTGLFAQFSNTVLAQATYNLSGRSSITALGAFGYLHFSQNGFLNANDALGQFGYNYALNAKDSIGLVYSYTSIFYPGLPNSIRSQMAGFSYGRKLTGRLAFQAFAGPDFVTIRSATGSANRTLASGLTSLTYSFQKGVIGVSAMRFVQPGSGVITGTTTDTLALFVSRRITTKWQAELNAGFARNSALPSTLAPFGTVFDSTFASATLIRPLGRHMSLQLGYQMEYQNSNSGVCNALVCGHAPALNIFGIGLSFFPNPIGI